MNSRERQKRLLRVVTADAQLIRAWNEGVSLTADTGRDLITLQRRVAVARWTLAREFRRQAEVMMAQKPPLCRSAVSRYYYSMYHTMRSVAFIAHGGDDHEKHSVLPGKTPLDFPHTNIWQNNLKSARDYRNQADYNPYPRADAAWLATANALRGQATDVLALAKTYLMNRGCTW